MAGVLEWTAAILFGVALLHTFSTGIFEKLSHRYPAHAGLFHLLGEVEIVFGLWAMVLMLVMGSLAGHEQAVSYMDSRNYTEPLFVFAIMVIAASKPITHLAGQLADAIAAALHKSLGLPKSLGLFFTLLSLLPLMGSLITEPAAMTVAAMLLGERYFKTGLPLKLKYAVVGVLFVNISIGGTLTHFAAPPVLMVATKWGFDTPFMLQNFGWKSAVAVFVNATLISLIFARSIQTALAESAGQTEQMPWWVTLVHLAFLAGVIVFAHHASVFMGLFLFFIGFTTAYNRFQTPLIFREALLVAFFLAGLVVLGGLQQWWLQPILTQLSPTALFYGSTALTAITDNAALTYLGSLVEGVNDEFKYALVAGAVAGGGLTIVANAPNPAGFAVLKSYFEDESINPLYLLTAAAIPTLVAIAAFQCL